MVNKLKKNIRFRKLFLRIWVLCLLILSVPVLMVGIIFYLSYNRFLENEILSQKDVRIGAINNITDSIITSCQKQMNIMNNNNDIVVFVNANPGNESLYNYVNISNQILMQSVTRDYLESIYIYSDVSKVIISNNGKRPIEKFDDYHFLESYFEYTTRPFFWSEIREKRIGNKNYKKIISLYKTISYGKKSNGVLAFNIDLEKFKQYLASLKNENIDETLCIVDENWNVIAEIWGDVENDLNIKDVYEIDFNQGYIRTNASVVYKQPIKGTSWYYIWSVPLKVYQLNFMNFTSSMIIVIILGFTIALFSTFFVSRNVYMPFKKIREMFRTSLLVMDEHQFIDDEETLILYSIKSTLEQNNTINLKLEERIKLLRKSQAIALQAQINPHFMYNTLDTISWNAMRLTGDKNEVVIMINKLASMLRFSLENTDTIITLEQELDHVKKYIEILSIRYKDKFMLHLDIDEETIKCKVIKIMLQPIVENAIYYGIKALEGKGTLIIRSRIQEDNLYVSVEDNGKGFDPDILEYQNSLLQTEYIKESSHIGISNVNQRIKLLFGDDYGLTIASVKDKGTKVTMKLPYLE